MTNRQLPPNTALLEGSASYSSNTLKIKTNKTVFLIAKMYPRCIHLPSPYSMGLSYISSHCLPLKFKLFKKSTVYWQVTTKYTPWNNIQCCWYSWHTTIVGSRLTRTKAGNCFHTSLWTSMCICSFQNKSIIIPIKLHSNSMFGCSSLVLMFNRLWAHSYSAFRNKRIPYRFWLYHISKPSSDILFSTHSAIIWGETRKNT